MNIKKTRKTASTIIFSTLLLLCGVAFGSAVATMFWRERYAALQKKSNEEKLGASCVLEKDSRATASDRTKLIVDLEDAPAGVYEITVEKTDQGRLEIDGEMSFKNKNDAVRLGTEL